MQSWLLIGIVVVLFSARVDAATLEEVVLELENPTSLDVYEYGSDLAGARPLVLLLHGCSQSAQSFAHDSGWLELAEQEGIRIVAVQQSSSNNASSCFQWWDVEDMDEGGGELAFMVAATELLQARFSTKREDTYVVGLSAGAFMAATLLADAPDLFEAGASLSGGPRGCADSLSSAFDCMDGDVSHPPSVWGDLARNGSSYGGSYPRLGIWHGNDDDTVAPQSSDELRKQWLALHALDQTVGTVEIINGHERYRYGKRPQVEQWRVAQLDHAVALDSSCGNAGDYALDVGLCSAERIWEFFRSPKPLGPEEEVYANSLASEAQEDRERVLEGDTPSARAGGCSNSGDTGGAPFALSLLLLSAFANGLRRLARQR